MKLLDIDFVNSTIQYEDNKKNCQGIGNIYYPSDYNKSKTNNSRIWNGSQEWLWLQMTDWGVLGKVLYSNTIAPTWATAAPLCSSMCSGPAVGRRWARTRGPGEASRAGGDKQQWFATVGGKEPTPVTGLTLRILMCIMVKKTRNSQLRGVTIFSSPVISRDQLVVSPPSEAEWYIFTPSSTIKVTAAFSGSPCLPAGLTWQLLQCVLIQIPGRKVWLTPQSWFHPWSFIWSPYVRIPPAPSSNPWGSVGGRFLLQPQPGLCFPQERGGVEAQSPKRMMCSTVQGWLLRSNKHFWWVGSYRIMDRAQEGHSGGGRFWGEDFVLSPIPWSLSALRGQTLCIVLSVTLWRRDCSLPLLCLPQEVGLVPLAVGLGVG